MADYAKLSMLRVFMKDSDEIEFKYIMENKATNKYQFCNFSKNIIEKEEFNTLEEAIESLTILKENGVIKEYQQI